MAPANEQTRQCLLRAKISQAAQANKSCSLTFPFVIGGRVRLTTLSRHNEYKAMSKKCVAKFMPQYNGPYMIINIDEAHSTVTLDLPNSPNIFTTFHASNVIPYVENDAILLPGRKFEHPEPVIVDSEQEFFICHIIDERYGFRYLVCWVGHRAEENRWLSGAKLKDTEALDIWLAKSRTK